MSIENEKGTASLESAQKYSKADIHDRIADAYYGKLGSTFMRETQRRIHWICNSIKGQSILDVGCSQGIVPILLAREGIRVIGIDISSRSIEEATQHLLSEPKHIQNQVEFINADFLSYDFGKLDIETVIISEVLEHLTQPQRFIEIAAKLLPNNGRLIVTVPFGINDFIDHKHTFYLLKPFKLINQLFEIQEIKMLGKWLGIIAHRRSESVTSSAAITFTDMQVEQLEKAFFQAERSLRDELMLIKTKLDDANNKYRAITEIDSVRKENIRKLEKINEQSKESFIILQNERDELKQKVENLELKNQRSNIAFYEAEKQIISLQTNFDASQDKLKDINNQYQSVIQQLSEVKQRYQASIEVDLVRKENFIRLQNEYGELKQKIDILESRNQRDTDTFRDTEKQIIILQSKFNANQEKLKEMDEQYQAAMKQVDKLKQHIEKEEKDHLLSIRALEKTKVQSIEVQAKLRNERNVLQQQAKFLRDEIKQLQKQLKESQLQSQRNDKAFQELENKLIALQDKSTYTEEKLEEKSKKYNDSTKQIEVLKLQIKQKETIEKESAKALELIQAKYAEAQVEFQNESETLQKEIEQLQLKVLDFDRVNNALKKANEKYRFSTEGIKKLKQDLSVKEDMQRISEQQFQQVKEKLYTANLKYRELTRTQIPSLKSQIEQLKLQKIAADERVIKTRATLSFQLGYLLIHHCKSLRGLMTLPIALWKWRKEVIKRREKGKIQQKVLETFVSPASDSLMIKRIDKHSVILHKLTDKTRKQLKVACIMDEFTFGSYQPECMLQQLTPEHWKLELEGFQPELLFIESAWRGKDDLWGSKVGHTSQELQNIVAWCRTNNVPTIFWNKEDPVHFETFLTTARLFDYVFTTDIDCIHRYKAALAHERVYLLPFACQPVTSNPIETYERKNAFSFAGAYYVRYLDRTRDLGNFVHTLPNFRPLEIYDRNFGKNDPNYQFPEEYQPFIVGTLPFNQIDKAYKGYRYAINLNSIKQSQTMFARRIFELLASNTITVSNFSRGVRLLFGDLVIATDNGNEMVQKLGKIASNETQERKLRLAALRKVMKEHTYERRLAYIVSKVKGKAEQIDLPNIAVVAFVSDVNELENILYVYQHQNYSNSQLIVITKKKIDITSSEISPRVQILLLSDIKNHTLHSLIEENVDWLATMVPQDYYGPNYLLDIALTTRYSNADVIGKVAKYVCINDVPVLQQQEDAYRPSNNLLARSAVIRLDKVADILLKEWLHDLQEKQLITDNGIAIDEFNYCLNGAQLNLRDVVSEIVDDLPSLDTGISIDELLVQAENIAPAVTASDERPVLTGKNLAANFSKAPSKLIKLEVKDNIWQVNSSLPDGKHEYLYETTEHSLLDLGIEKQFKFYLDVSPGLNIQLVILFLDAQKQKISHVIKHPNRNHEVEVPVGTEMIRLGLRFYAGGNAEIKGLVLGHRNVQPAEIIGQAEHLVLTNHYPSYEDLYRNGFVHSRVRAYREKGVRCDVFRLRSDEITSYHEFEGIDVITGSQEALHKMLCSGRYKSVLVHFLDSSMWEVLHRHIDNIPVLVWVHGAEIQPWYRRDFNNQTEEQRIVAKMKSEKRMEFWRGLLKNIPKNLKLVFVSNYFAEEVMEDLGFRLPESHYTIIHNPINTELFNYKEKSAEQRKKVLSIRPYASLTYANDLSVQAIELLAKKPYFSQMEFRMIGDGTLFEQTLEPLRKFNNVHIEQAFLKQDEIAALHKKYGIFLVPSRMDTQGVSRDEAMSSGLVPVTNAVAAIPEFVSNECGILAAGENAKEMAEGIAMLVEHPEKFTQMSKAAAERVRNQSDFKEVIKREISLFFK